MPTKEYFTQWRDKHREELTEYNKKYYETNKEKMVASLIVPVVCECGFETSKCNLKRHQKGSRHAKRMALL